MEGFAAENDLERLMLEAHAGRVEMPAFLRALLSSRVFLAPQGGERRGRARADRPHGA